VHDACDVGSVGGDALLEVRAQLAHARLKVLAVARVLGLGVGRKVCWGRARHVDLGREGEGEEGMRYGMCRCVQRDDSASSVRGRAVVSCERKTEAHRLSGRCRSEENEQQGWRGGVGATYLVDALEGVFEGSGVVEDGPCAVDIALDPLHVGYGALEALRDGETGRDTGAGQGMQQRKSSSSQ